MNIENIKIRKRDGSIEDFSNDKLIASITKSGVNVKDAQNIAGKVVSWMVQNAENGLVDSTDLRNTVYVNIKPDFPAEADSFQAYKKS